MGSRRTVRYLRPPHSAEEMWSFAQSHPSSMNSLDRRNGDWRRKMMTVREEKRICDGLVASSF